MDVGCGAVGPNYPFSDKANVVTCVDWKIRTIKPFPPNIECINGDFTKLELPANSFDALIAADVFEHILLERNSEFVDRCVSLLRPGGHMIVSVPHQGSFSFLDPYQIKPALHRLFWRFGLYKRTHNGSCDIRKGHKHYAVQELVDRFRPLQLLDAVYFGYLFDPLLTWAYALSRGSGKFPFFAWLYDARQRELNHDYGSRSFNVAVKFYKPVEAPKGSD